MSAKAEGGRPRGRPSSFTPDIARRAAKVASLGASDAEIADILGIDTATLYRWKNQHEEFSEALRAGKSPADDRVERSLYQRAIGYTYDAVKVTVDAKTGKQTITPYREHVPPDPAAGIFWLVNRRKESWRHVSRQEHTGADGGPIQSEDVTDPKAAARRIAFALAQGAKKETGA